MLDELDWVIERACEHMGPDRASRYLRKFYPWYVERLGGTRALQAAVQRAATIAEVRELIATGTAPVGDRRLTGRDRRLTGRNRRLTAVGCAHRGWQSPAG